MLKLIPLFIYIHILYSEVCRKVYYLGICKHLIIYIFSQETLRCSCKYNVGFLCQFQNIVVFANIICIFIHASKNDGITITCKALRTVSHYFYIFSLQQQSYQLSSCISRSSHNAYLYHKNTSHPFLRFYNYFYSFIIIHFL